VGDLSLDDILIRPLKRIATEGGDVMHALKKSDDGYKNFGEVYFSWVEQGAIKAWKCHQRMTLNLVVPVGEVHFVFHYKASLVEQNNRPNREFRCEKLGNGNYSRITVPPGIWFGFKGLASGSSLLMNVADMEHDPDEMLRKPVSGFPYNWSLK
jgi:dTDP-4-dehydrorhamnose 3,5-epimerase